MIVLDTSVLVDLFRGRDTEATRRLVRIEETGAAFGIPAICCQELLQGARDEGEWRLLSEYLSTQHIIAPLDPWATHRAAARIWCDCRRAGRTPRSTVDCLIAQLTLEQEGGCLLHADVDFEHIARVRPLRMAMDL